MFTTVLLELVWFAQLLVTATFNPTSYTHSGFKVHAGISSAAVFNCNELGGCGTELVQPNTFTIHSYCSLILIWGQFAVWTSEGMIRSILAKVMIEVAEIISTEVINSCSAHALKSKKNKLIII